MGKAKKKQKKVGPKPAKKAQIPNPFEIKKNRLHHNIVGHRPRHSAGKPIASHSKAIQKQKLMLQNRHLLTHKSNTFVDRRFGEREDEFGDTNLAARITQAKKKFKRNIYNLNNDEVLTHLGESIDNIEQHDLVKDSDEEDDQDANLGADFIEKAHFGGLLFKKSDSEQPLSHKETIDKLIVESKKKKLEMKDEKEKTVSLTEKLDEQWKSVLPIMAELKKKPAVETSLSDTYDMTVQELKFEPRGTPAKMTKTEEQLEKEARYKLAELQRERLNRMQNDEKIHSNLKDLDSADSIYDGLELEIDSEVKEDEKDDEENNADEDDKSDEEDDAEEDQKKSDDAEEDEEDKSDEENETSMKEKSKITAKNMKIKKRKISAELMTYSETIKQLTNIPSANMNDKEVSLQSIMQGINIQEELENLITLVLSYIDISCKQKCFDPKILDSVTRLLHLLAQDFNLEMANCFKEKLQQFDDTLKLSTLLFFKLVIVLFSTSDFRHSVVTPVMTFMSGFLNKNYEGTFNEILSRLFICGLFHECIDFSKRVCLEPIFCLLDIIFLGTKNSFTMSKYQMNTSHLTTKENKLLLVTKPTKQDIAKLSLTLFQQDEEIITKQASDTRISVLYCAVELLTKFVLLYQNVPVFSKLFKDVPDICYCLPLKYYPEKLKSSVEKLLERVGLKTPLNYLCFERKKPKPLKLFEPKFDMRFTERSVKNLTGFKVQKRLSHKIKREEKGLIREVRRETQFISNHQLAEKRKADEERNEKVKKLYQDLAQQQHDTKIFRKNRK